MEVEFNRLGLKEGDYLVIKVKANDLSDEELKSKLFEVRNDEFVQFVESKGHKVLVVHPGLEFNILRMEENDKLVVYVDLTPFNNEEANNYIDFLNFKLESHIEKDKLVIVPSRKNNVALAVKKDEVEE
jgi:hypothetical protein